MKKIIISLIFIFSVLFLSEEVFAKTSIQEKKREIIALYNSNNLEEAYNQISKITEDERDFMLWYLLGNISQDMGNDTNASFFLQKSILLNPAFDKAHYNLGNIYLKEEKYNSAIREYKSAIKHKKDFAFYHYNLGCAYIGLKDYKNAKNALKTAIQLNPNIANFHYNLALAYKNLNNEKEAKKELEKYNNLKEKEEN